MNFNTSAERNGTHSCESPLSRREERALALLLIGGSPDDATPLNADLRRIAGLATEGERSEAARGFIDRRADRDDLTMRLANADPLGPPPAEGDDDEPATDEDRTSICVSSRIMEMADEAEAFLSRDPEVFQRGGSLVRVVAIDPRDGDAGRKVIASLGEATLAERLTRGPIDWIALKSRGEAVEPRLVDPPRKVVAALLARGSWRGIRTLRAILETPCLAPDGRVLDRSGYDPSSGFLVSLDGEYGQVEARPSEGDARRAADKLLGLVADFPFANPAHKAAWLAALLAPIARPAIDGPCPLFLLDANAPGSGKSLLCDLIGLIALGRKMPRSPLPSGNRGDDDETRKRLTAIFLEGRRATLFDNASGAIGVASLDAALTGDLWEDRVLGESRMTTGLPILTAFYATGNNLGLRGDVHRRVLPIRLETDLERPETRTGFAIPDLPRHVKDRRREFLIDALTILRAYVVAGKPKQDNQIIGSYEAFCELVGGAVRWTTGFDPFEGREELADRDEDREARAALVAGWAELDGGREQGVCARDAIQAVKERATAHPALANAFALMVSGTQELPTSSRLSARLKACAKRPIDGRRIVLAGKSHNAALWRVETTDRPIEIPDELHERDGFRRETDAKG